MQKKRNSRLILTGALLFGLSSGALASAPGPAKDTVIGPGLCDHKCNEQNFCTPANGFVCTQDLSEGMYVVFNSQGEAVGCSNVETDYVCNCSSEVDPECGS